MPNGWDETTFEWPNDAENPIRIDVGARSPEEAAKLGVKVGDSITIPKNYRPLLGTRANARSFDDRVGDTALISAVWSLGSSLRDRDVTFVWSTGEELGLVGAAALAKRLAAEHHEPDYVFAVDTLVSSDSPLESKRFGDAQIGKGFAIRAVDGSNIAPAPLVDRLVHSSPSQSDPRAIGCYWRRQRRRHIRSLRRGGRSPRLAAPLFSLAGGSDRYAGRGRPGPHRRRHCKKLVGHTSHASPINKHKLFIHSGLL